MSKPTSTLQIRIPHTSLTDAERERVVNAVKLLREPFDDGSFMCIDLFDTNNKVIELVPEDVPVCDPETVCAENCAGLPDCQSQK